MLEATEIRSASILIVDDQEANVMLLEQMLRNAGYTNITATMDPTRVVAMHAAHRYDLILLDLQMPEMDGFEVIDALKKIQGNGYLPVLVITAQPGHKLRALQAGAKDFVSKPFDLVEVQTRIHNMLEVRLLYKTLDVYNQVLEKTVLERTAELRESEARFQRFTELSSDWYWEQDAQGKLVKFSGPVLEMLGMPSEGGSASFSGEWNKAERELLDANIAARRPFLDFVYSRSKRDGSVQYLQVSGEPMFDTSSRFTGYRGVGQDITERMVPDQQQRRFRSAMDVIDQGLCLVDQASMHLVDVNLTVCRMVGYTREEMLALDLASIGVDQGDVQARMFEALAACGDGHRQLVTLRRKSGSTIAAAIDWRALQVAGAWVMVGVISADGELA